MKVFISATSNGLCSYRNNTAKILNALGAETSYQENYPSDYRMIEQFLKSEILKCQFVICLIGNSYGSEPNNNTTHPRSYSQLEYDFACEIGLPLYIFDGRACDLDLSSYQDEPEEKKELQRLFWEKIEHYDKRLRQTFKTQNDLDEQLIKIWKDRSQNSNVQVELLPTPLARLHFVESKTESRKRVYLTRLMAFVGCLGAVETMYNAVEQSKLWSIKDLNNTIQLVELIAEKMCIHKQNPFITKFWCDNLSFDSLKKDAAIEVEELSESESARMEVKWGRAFTSLLKRMEELNKYLLVQIELNENNRTSIRIYRGLDPDRLVDVELIDDTSINITEDSFFLLSLERNEAICLSPVFRSHQDNKKVVCGLSAREKKEFPLGMELNSQEVQSVCFKTCGWRGKLLTQSTWDRLSQCFLVSTESGYSTCGNWNILGNPYSYGKFIDLHFANKQSRSDKLYILHLCRSNLDKQKLNRLLIRLKNWQSLASDGNDLVCQVVDSHLEDDRPYIVTSNYFDFQPLSEVTTFENMSVIEYVIKAAIQLCGIAGNHGIRLLNFPRKHILIKEKTKYYFVGFASTVIDGDILSNSKEDCLKLYQYYNEFAPELRRGWKVDATCDVFAIGILLQKLLGKTLSSLPLGETNVSWNNNMWDDWRKDPLECFIFHCLARDRYRRFQSIEQCSEFSTKCFQKDAMSLLSEPEMIPLGNNIDISKYPITNFQFERFCQEHQIEPPTKILGWRYACPFAPVVNVSILDCIEYCAWLNMEYNNIWRLPTESEWLSATGAICNNKILHSFPWGEDYPTIKHSNFSGNFNGPTVVGSHQYGVSKSGCNDLSGNVWEWCVDRPLKRGLRFVKGGSFASPRSKIMINARDSRLFAGRFFDVGFRVIRERK